MPADADAEYRRRVALSFSGEAGKHAARISRAAHRYWAVEFLRRAHAPADAAAPPLRALVVDTARPPPGPRPPPSAPRRRGPSGWWTLYLPEVGCTVDYRDPAVPDAPPDDGDDGGGVAAAGTGLEALNALPLRLGDELVVRVTVAEPASGRSARTAGRAACRGAGRAR